MPTLIHFGVWCWWY